MAKVVHSRPLYERGFQRVHQQVLVAGREFNRIVSRRETHPKSPNYQIQRGKGRCDNSLRRGENDEANTTGIPCIGTMQCVL